MKLAVTLLYDKQVTILSVNVELRGVFAPNRKASFRVKVWPNKFEVYTVRKYIYIFIYLFKEIYNLLQGSYK